MGQRLSDSAVRPVRHSVNDPYWKTPLGFKKNGQPFYPVGGASPDDPEGGEGGSGGSGDGGSGGGSEGQQGGEGGGGTGDGSDAGGKDTETVSKAELDKVLERMKAADRRAEAAERKARELEEKDLSEQEKVAKRVPELEAQVSTLTDENKGLQAKVAFLESNTHSWHNPEAALKLADLSEVWSDDGTLDKKALKSTMEKLAKDNPFLVKTAQDDDKDGKGGGNNGAGGNGQPSGSAAGSGGKGGQGNVTDEAALRKKYPALNV